MGFISAIHHGEQTVAASHPSLRMAPAKRATKVKPPGMHRLENGGTSVGKTKRLLANPPPAKLATKAPKPGRHRSGY